MRSCLLRFGGEEVETLFWMGKCGLGQSDPLISIDNECLISYICEQLLRYLKLSIPGTFVMNLTSPASNWHRCIFTLFKGNKSKRRLLCFDAKLTCFKLFLNKWKQHPNFWHIPCSVKIPGVKLNRIFFSFLFLINHFKFHNKVTFMSSTYMQFLYDETFLGSNWPTNTNAVCNRRVSDAFSVCSDPGWPRCQWGFWLFFVPLFWCEFTCWQDGCFFVLPDMYFFPNKQTIFISRAARGSVIGTLIS